jgi:hypothetical protein
MSTKKTEPLNDQVLRTMGVLATLLLFKRQHRYDWWSWGGLLFILVGTVCQIMANRV